MKDLTFETLIAVFEEIFGRGLFWALVVVAVVFGIAFVYVLIRDRGLRARRFLFAEVLAPFGAVAAIAFVLFITSSRLSDIGGPVDLIMLILIGLSGAVGVTIVAYTLRTLAAPRLRDKR